MSPMQYLPTRACSASRGCSLDVEGTKSCSNPPAAVMLSSGDMTRAASGDGLPYVQTVPSSPAFESDSRDSRADTADSRADTEADEARRLRTATQLQKASSEALAADLEASKIRARELDQESLQLKLKLA